MQGHEGWPRVTLSLGAITFPADLVVPTVVLIGALLLIRTLVRWQRLMLAEKFTALDPLVGKTREQVVTRCGVPSLETPQADGGVVLQWKARGYVIDLAFDEHNICKCVIHEGKG